jgi:hypothetical protein
MIKYNANMLGKDKIEEVEIVSETAKFITRTGSRWGRKETKESACHKMCDTWEEAHAFLVANANKEHESAKRRLQYTEDRAKRIAEMVKP